MHIVDLQFFDAQSRRSYPRFSFQADAQHAAVAVPDLDLQPGEPLSLKPNAAGTLGPMRVAIDASRTSECGRYKLENGDLVAERLKPKRLDVVVEVDDLEAFDQKNVPLTNVLFFYPIKGKPLVKEIKVFAVKGKLTPEKLRVEIDKDQSLVNVNNASANPKIRLKVEKEPCVHHVDRQRSGVLVKLEFLDVEPSFVQYSGKIAITYDELNLARTYDCAVQQVEVRKPKGEPAKR
jgi:hypothetical protein